MLERFGLAPRSGRSDITIGSTGDSNVFAIVECKHSSNEEVNSTRQFRDAAIQVLDYVEDYEGNPIHRLSRSAIVMRRLPTEVSERGGVAGDEDPVALSAVDLLKGSSSLDVWLKRLADPIVP